MLNSENTAYFLTKIGDKTEMVTLTTSVSHEEPDNAISQEKN